MAGTVLLAIETSQRAGGVALRRAGDAIDVEMLRPRARHDDDLLPAIDRLLARNRMQPGDLNAVGVSIGPGGFTGLRIAVGTAKMLAEVLKATLVAVPTALVVAEAYGRQAGGRGPVIVALASKRGSFWSTRLHRKDDRWDIVGEPALVEAMAFDPAGLVCLLADEHLPDAAVIRCRQVGVAVVPPRFDPAAAIVAAEGLLAAGRTVDPLAALPLYPRAPEAVRLAEASDPSD